MFTCSTYFSAAGSPWMRTNRSTTGGDDLGLGHVFAGQRAVVERAVAGEEPFAGCVEGTEEVFEVEARVSFPGVPRLHAATTGDESLLLGVQRVDEAAGVVPLVVEHEVDVTEFLGRDFGEDCEVVGPHDDGLLGLLVLSGRAFFDDVFEDVLDVEVELVGRSGSRGAVTVDEELLEVPVAGGNLVDFGRPDAVGAFLPALDCPSAAEDGCCSLGGFVGDWCCCGAAVLWFKDEGLGQGVMAVGNNHFHRFGERAFGLECSDGIAGLFLTRRTEQPACPGFRRCRWGATWNSAAWAVSPAKRTKRASVERSMAGLQAGRRRACWLASL